MKRFICALLCAFTLLTCLVSCGGGEDNGEFYFRYSSDSAVIDLRTEKTRYESEGDVYVMAEVGFANLKGGSDVADGTLRVEYLVVEDPYKEDKRPMWEMTVDYESSWSDEKYAPSENDGGEVYPVYKETVELIFPDEAGDGILLVRLFAVSEDSSSPIAELKLRYTLQKGVLTFIG